MAPDDQFPAVIEVMVGSLRMTDEKGVDLKVLCVALGDPIYVHVKALHRVSPHKLREDRPRWLAEQAGEPSLGREEG